jgi:hypothetical protein
MKQRVPSRCQSKVRRSKVQSPDREPRHWTLGPWTRSNVSRPARVPSRSSPLARPARRKGARPKRGEGQLLPAFLGETTCPVPALVQGPAVQSPKSGLRTSDFRPWTLDFGPWTPRKASRPKRPVKNLSGPDADRPQSARRRLPGIFSPLSENGSPPPPGILFVPRREQGSPPENS